MQLNIFCSICVNVFSWSSACLCFQGALPCSTAEPCSKHQATSGLTGGLRRGPLCPAGPEGHHGAIRQQVSRINQPVGGAVCRDCHKLMWDRIDVLSLL